MPLPDLCCARCRRRHPVRSLDWLCACGGLLDVTPFDREPPRLDAGGPASMWRYASALPVPGKDAVSLGEGMTPLLPVPDLPGVTLKVDYLMPTLSFKDRGAAVLATLARELGVRRAVADSSGNAGTAVAAYLSRAGVSCEVFVPAATPAGKLAQIAAHGATIRAVEGTREDVAAAAAVAAAQPDVFYASHVYHPYFLHGTKTYAYEIWEQTRGELPRTVVVPVGNGTLLLGAHLGFAELAAHGLIDRPPVLIGVQAAACPPLAEAMADGADESVPVTTTPTTADGIAIARPARGAQILAAVRETGGTIVTVDEEGTGAARADLAAQGLFVEPTSAVCWAALLAARAGTAPAGATWAGALPHLRAESVVVPLCGAGLKSP
ncbi:threonine synthase [Rhizomonospora bruguierae]|uniref:threonine synthase n=1 Tax=Rhizomonospora bruguierae TaxID=1581705 RepID=UPI001BCE40B1|nr:threonine synthase [Micromonospora sp. NBRC 107566]